MQNPTSPTSPDGPPDRGPDPVLAALPSGTATGLGSWPGTDVAQALAVTRGELVDLPHLPELPARGPGADLVGRAAARLVDLPVDLQPAGWRLVDHPGVDQARAAAYWREDLDRLAHAYDGWSGPLKVQLAGPWTLAASVWLPRGDRAVVDRGATRDLVASSAQAASDLVGDVGRLVPGARVVLQLDEPSLPSVLQGRLPRMSGWGRLPAVDASDVEHGLEQVVRSAAAAGAVTVVHCCADQVPVAMLARTGADALSLDTSLLGPSGWESVAAAVENGVRLWAGAIATSGPLPSAAAASAALLRAYQEVGLPVALLADVVVTPACGLTGCSPQAARATLARTVETGRALAERAAT